MKSVYLERFKKLKEKENLYKLKGSLLLVERIPEPEIKTKSGIIMNINKNIVDARSALTERPQFCMVLDVGEGYTDDDGNIVEGSMSVKAGDIVLLPSISVKYFTVFGTVEDYDNDVIGLAKESEVQLHFDGQESFDTYFNILNQKA